MFLLGIDIAKLNHVASCIDSSTNEVIFSNFKFKNDFKCFGTLLNKIKSFDAKNLINFLFRHDFKVALINPQIRQSGNFNASSCRMSKKGTPYLRYALIFTAWNYCQTFRKI